MFVKQKKLNEVLTSILTDLSQKEKVSNKKWAAFSKKERAKQRANRKAIYEFALKHYELPTH